MQKKLMNPSAYMPYQPNEKGFTFITTLAMLAILAITLPFLGLTMKMVQPNTSYDELSINEFFRFIRDELIQSRSYYIKDNKLYLIQEYDKTAIISQYESQIQRQVNHRGHEIYLRDITEIIFTDDDFGLKIEITDMKGTIYEKTFTFYN